MPVLTALSPDFWQRLCDNVDSNLVLLRSVGVAALPGSKLLRVGRTPLSTRAEVLGVVPESRRIWVQSSFRAGPRVVSPTRRVPTSVHLCCLRWLIAQQSGDVIDVDGDVHPLAFLAAFHAPVPVRRCSSWLSGDVTLFTVA